jgi:hypothetical protein
MNRFSHSSGPAWGVELFEEAFDMRLHRALREAAAQASGPPPTHIGGPADQHGEQASAMAMQKLPARDRMFHRVRR